MLAPAVLAWRTRHEAERALAVERETARRRHRRLALVAVVALVALAGTMALAVWALSQRARGAGEGVCRDAGALAAKARELEANAIVQLDRDPELGLLLATHAARLAPAAATEDVLRRRIARVPRPHCRASLGSPVSDLVVAARRRPCRRHRATAACGSSRAATPAATVLAPRRARGRGSSRAGAHRAQGELTVRRLPRGDMVATIPVPPDTRFAAPGPQARRFIIAGRRGASVVDAEGKSLASLPHPAGVQRAEFSPNSMLIATAGADGDAIVWSGFGMRLRTFRDQGEQGINIFDVRFSHLSRLVVTASSDGTARIWNVRSGRAESTMPLHGNHVRRARFGDNEDSVLTASHDGTARTWKVDTGGPRAAFAGHTETVTGAVFIAGDRMATASEDGTVRTWVAQLQPPLRARAFDPRPPHRSTAGEGEGSPRDPRDALGSVTLSGHRDDVLSVEVSRDNSRVVTASKDGDARIWDPRTGEPVWVLRGHGGTVFDASFSPNGRCVVTGGPRTAGVWDTGTGERTLPQGPEGPIRAEHSPRQRGSSPVARTAFGRTSVTFAATGALAALAERRLARTGREF